MSPAPVPEHQRVNANIIGEFRNAIKKSGCKKCKVYDYVDVKISEDTIIQPDVLIVCKPITKNFLGDIACTDFISGNSLKGSQQQILSLPGNGH